MPERHHHGGTAPNAKRAGILTLAALPLLLLCAHLGGRELLGPDETRYTTIAGEMRAAGDLLVPRYRGEPYAHKPPVFFWLILAVEQAGVDAKRAILVPALAGAAALAAVTGLAARHLLGSRHAGAWAAAIGATTALGASTAIVGRMDGLFAACVTAAVAALWLALAREDRRTRLRWALAAHAAMGAAVLVKGPLGVLFPYTVLAAFALLRRDPGVLRRVCPARGLLLTAAVAAAWIVPAAAAGGPAYRDELLFRQTVGRAVGSFAHAEPVWYYAGVMPLALLPWTPLVVAGLVHCWRERQRPEAAFVLAWLAGPLALLTALSSKLQVYALPLLPAAAIAAAHLLAEVREAAAANRQAGRSLAIAGLIVAAVGVAVVGAAGPVLGWQVDVHVAALGGTLCCGGLVVLAFGLARRPIAAAASLAAVMAVAAGPLLAPVLVRFAAERSVRPFASRLAAMERGGASIALFNHDDPAYLLYGGSAYPIIRTNHEALAYLEPGREMRLLVVDGPRWNHFPPELRNWSRVAEVFLSSGEPVYLLASDPDRYRVRRARLTR